MIYPVAAFKVGALRQQWNNIMSGNVSLDEPAVIDRVTESFKGQLRVLCKYGRKFILDNTLVYSFWFSLGMIRRRRLFLMQLDSWRMFYPY